MQTSQLEIFPSSAILDLTAHPSSKSPTGLERFLLPCSNQESNNKSSRRDPSATETLKKQKREPRQARKTQWNITFDELIAFIDEHKRLPGEDAEQLEEQELAEWMNKQNKGYRENRKYLKDEHRLLWKQLVDAFPHLFNTCASFTTTSSHKKQSVKIEPNAFHPSAGSAPVSSSSSAPVRDVLPPPSMESQEKQHSYEPNMYHHYTKMDSADLHDFFQHNTGEFIRYHLNRHGRIATSPTPAELPLPRIIAKLEAHKHKKPKTLLDLGCGILPVIRDLFQRSNQYEVRSFDHISLTPGVEACDLSHLPVEDDSADFVVLSQAMWGLNCMQYLLEAYRVLDPLGRMYVGEPTDKWTPDGGRPAAKLMELLGECGFAIVDQSIDKFSVFTCVKK
jgi:hypothetical protein